MERPFECPYCGKYRKDEVAIDPSFRFVACDHNCGLKYTTAMEELRESDELVGGVFEDLQRLLGRKVFTLDAKAVREMAKEKVVKIPNSIVDSITGIPPQTEKFHGSGVLSGFCGYLFDLSSDEVRTAMVREVAEYIVAMEEMRWEPPKEGATLDSDCVVLVIGDSIAVDVYLGATLDPTPKPSIRSSDLNEVAQVNTPWRMARALSTCLFRFFDVGPKGGISIYERTSPRKMFARSMEPKNRMKLRPHFDRILGISAASRIPSSDPEFGKIMRDVRRGRAVFQSGVVRPPPVWTESAGFELLRGEWRGELAKWDDSLAKAQALDSASSDPCVVLRAAPLAIAEDVKSASARLSNEIRTSWAALRLGILYFGTEEYTKLCGLCFSAANNVYSGIEIASPTVMGNLYNEAKKIFTPPTNTKAGPVLEMLQRHLRAIEDAYSFWYHASLVSAHVLVSNGGIRDGGMIVIDKYALKRSDRKARMSGEIFGIHPGEHSKLACVACALYDSPVFIPSEDILVLGKFGIGTKAKPDGDITKFAGPLRYDLIDTRGPEFRAETFEEFKTRIEEESETPSDVPTKELETPPPPLPRDVPSSSTKK